MLNQFILVARVRDISDIEDKTQLTVVVKQNSGDITVPVYLIDGMAENAKAYLEEDAIVGLKGIIDTDQNGLILVAQKMTFLSSKKEINK